MPTLGDNVSATSIAFLCRQKQKISWNTHTRITIVIHSTVSWTCHILSLLLEAVLIREPFSSSLSHAHCCLTLTVFPSKQNTGTGAITSSEPMTYYYYKPGKFSFRATMLKSSRKLCHAGMCNTPVRLTMHWISKWNPIMIDFCLMTKTNAKPMKCTNAQQDGGMLCRENAHSSCQVSQ